MQAREEVQDHARPSEVKKCKITQARPQVQDPNASKTPSCKRPTTFVGDEPHKSANDFELVHVVYPMSSVNASMVFTAFCWYKLGVLTVQYVKAHL